VVTAAPTRRPFIDNLLLTGTSDRGVGNWFVGVSIIRTVWKVAILVTLLQPGA
jgi:hypothetical protein